MSACALLYKMQLLDTQVLFLFIVNKVGMGGSILA